MKQSDVNAMLDAAILSVMKDARERTVDDIANRLKIPRRFVQKGLARLKRARKVQVALIGGHPVFRLRITNQILELLADGRENTSTDVALRLGINQQAAALELSRMSKRGQVAKTVVQYVTVYRLPRDKVAPPMGMEPV